MVAVSTVQQRFGAGRGRLELEHLRDFTGGLNLNDDPYNLAKNESFDLQNIDFDRRGGFGVRRGSKPFIAQSAKRTITAAGASRTTNVVTATGLSPLNGDPGGLVVGQTIIADFVDNTYDGTFVVTAAAGGGSTATWAQTAADDASAGTGTITTGLVSEVDSGYTYQDAAFVRHILAARGGYVVRWDGAAWQDVIVLASSGRTIFAEMNNKLYILPPNLAIPRTWTGSGLATALTTVVGNYNDDLTAPNQGNFPQSATIATHQQVMWAGGVVDTAGTFRCRLRWSHIAQPEDWRTNDFIDIDADDENGFIRALVPFGDRLLVFKDKAIYAVHGSPPAGFSVVTLTKEIGTPSQHSVVATEDGVFFWDVDKGAFSYDGSTFEWIFKPLFPLIEDNKINNQFSFQVIAEFHNERLWLSVPTIAPPYNGEFLSFVFAPAIGKRGAWTLHTKTAFGWWVHRGSAGGDLHLVGGNDAAAGVFLMEFDVENLFTDQDGASALQRIVAWYTTRWFDAENSALEKRWKRPIVVMRGGSTQQTSVDVLSNYDPTKVVKTFNLFTILDPTEGTWDVGNWDAVNWAAELTLGGEKSVVLRGAPLGSGIAKALRFKNIVQGQDWRVNGLTMKYVGKRIRS